MFQAAQSGRARIGVTSADDPTPDNYVKAVERLGAEPIVLRNVPANIDADLAGLSGLLITGGTDIAASRYGAQAHAANDVPDHDRDSYELLAVRRAHARGMPVLAICRGMQIANVAWGGTLVQHLPDVVDGKIVHKDLDRKFETFAEHTVTLEADSYLAHVLGMTRFQTNASHHQAVDCVGNGLRIIARTDDGIVEALERPGDTAFWLAVQWHPERLLDADQGRSRAIFDTFLAAAIAYG